MREIYFADSGLSANLKTLKRMETMTGELKLHDVVALTKPISEQNLRRGDVGVIIDIGSNNQYRLELADRNGVPYATPTVPADELIKVYLRKDGA